MATAHVQFVTKNGACLGDRIAYRTDVIPRAGELIRAPQGLPGFADLRCETFMVQSVVYDFGSEGFEPLITAREWMKGLREELLASRGWIPSEARLDIEYDEDDQALSE